MKNKTLWKSFLCLPMLILLLFGGNASANIKEDPVKITQSFYTQYMQLYFKIVPPDAPAFKKLMQNNITPSFLKKIKSAKICQEGKDPVCTIEEVSPKNGYVYIIRAQDAYDDWTHVIVEPIKISSGLSVVKVSLGGLHEKAHVLTVSLKKINTHWKIDSVSDLSPAKYRFQ